MNSAPSAKYRCYPFIFMPIISPDFELLSISGDISKGSAKPARALAHP
jgi:hypothetical protein